MACSLLVCQFIRRLELDGAPFRVEQIGIEKKKTCGPCLRDDPRAIQFGQTIHSDGDDLVRLLHITIRLLPYLIACH